MTPREKAQELFDKFELSFAGVISADEDWESLGKQCALIAVDEILNLDLHDVGDYKDFDTPSEWYISYWMEIKEEIEKL